MDETMNLNGMGVITASSPSPLVNTIDSSNEIIDNQQTKSDNLEVVNVSSFQSTDTTLNATNLEDPIIDASNEIDFHDLDMIKELRAEEEASRKKESIFSTMDFGPLKKYLEDDDVTDISYSNGGQLWLKTLSKGVYRVDERDINDALIEKIAFQCSNVMGKTFNMAHPFLDSESAELRMNFIHDSIAKNGIAVVFRKTPAKIRLEKEKLMKENYVSLSIHDFLIKAVQGHCNIIMCGETGSGKTEFLKYLASHTFENEKIVTVEDTLELHLDRIYPHRDIVAMKTNNVASYSDVLVTCMRQNPIWILLSEVRSAEAVTAVRNSISSGHFILSTIHADKAANIPYRLYSLLESNIDVEQFLNTIYRYVQIGVFLRGRFDPKQGRYIREIGEVTEFYVNENNECITNTIYQKTIRGDVTYKPISEHLLDYLEGQGMDMKAIREANGDLEKAQEYIDELSNEKPGQETNVINDKNDEDSDDDSSASALLQSATVGINNISSDSLVQPIVEVPSVMPVATTLEKTPVEVAIEPIQPVVSSIVEQQKTIPVTVDMNNNIAPSVVPPIVEVPSVMPVATTLEKTPVEVAIEPIQPVVGPIVEQQKTIPVTVDMNNNIAPSVVPPITEVPSIMPVEVAIEPTHPVVSSIIEEPKYIFENQNANKSMNFNPNFPQVEPENTVVTPVIQDIKNLTNPTEKPQPIKPLVDSIPIESNNNQLISNFVSSNDSTSSSGNGSSNINFTVPNITNIQ